MEISKVYQYSILLYLSRDTSRDTSRDIVLHCTVSILVCHLSHWDLCQSQCLYQSQHLCLFQHLHLSQHLSFLEFLLLLLGICEGDAADEATIIDYSKTGANKR